MFHRVAIIGLGLIGGSIGLALKKEKAALEVLGFDWGSGVCEHARKVGAIDQVCDSLVDAVRGAELVILATPVGAMRMLLQSIANFLSPGTVVTDVASTKAQVISWAEEFYLNRFHLLGVTQWLEKSLAELHPQTRIFFSGASIV